MSCKSDSKTILMNLLFLICCSMAVLWLGYRFYGNFLGRIIGLRDSKVTPAHALRDDVDFVPAGKWYLLGQHFSAIAAAGLSWDPFLPVCGSAGCRLWKSKSRTKVPPRQF